MGYVDCTQPLSALQRDLHYYFLKNIHNNFLNVHLINKEMPFHSSYKDLSLTEMHSQKWPI